MSRDAFDDAWLGPVLRELAESDALEEAPPHVERSLRAAFRAGPRRTRRARHAGWWLAAAAATLAAWSAIQESAPPRTPETADDADVAGFLALVEGEPFAELDAVQVVRVRLPGSALARLAGPVAAGVEGTVDAQVILGQDGVARAIRFVE